MSTKPVVQLRNLTKRVGDKAIVENLTFDIYKGEVFGFLGPNGAGKTTTIRMIMGLISMSEGQVLVNGVDVARNFEEAMKHIGAIVENPEMYKFLSGYDNLWHFAKMTPGVTDERIHEIIRVVGLENRIKEKVSTYSLGMRQRLGLAQALLHNPSVLILDEPTNGLDPAGIRELRDHLRELAEKEGLAVIVSSHLLSEMELMCDRVAIIQNGKLVSVQGIHDLIGGGEQENILFEVSDPAAAQRALAAVGTAVLVMHPKGVEVNVTRDQIPPLVKALVQANIDIYSVHEVTKTLEESFLEITGGGQIG